MQAGQYFSEYIDAMKRIRNKLGAADRLIVEKMIANVRAQGVFFSLPMDGILSDRKHRIMNGEVLRPPYDWVVLEYPATKNEVDTDGYFSCSKRIIIVKAGKEGVYIMPCAYVDKDDTWVPHMFYAFFRYDQEDIFVEATGTARVKVKYDVSLPELVTARRKQMSYLSNEQFVQRIAEDLEDEVYAYIDFCYVLNTHEVTFTDVLPDKAVNQMRRARGKAPLFTYKTLTIGGPKEQGHGKGGGTHASPRSHMRRGHFRTLKSGKRVWINSMFVKGNGEGFVHKDYKVVGPQA